MSFLRRRRCPKTMPAEDREIARAPDGSTPLRAYGRRMTRHMTAIGRIRRCVRAAPALVLLAAAAAACTTDAHGNTATARRSAPDGARFAFAKEAGRWRIDS